MDGKITYTVTPRGAFFYHDRELFEFVDAPQHLVNLGRAAGDGELVFHVPWLPAPVPVYDQPWLLRLGSELYLEASRMMEGEP